MSRLTWWAHRTQVLGLAGIALACVLALLVWHSRRPPVPVPGSPVRIALPNQVSAGALFYARQRDLFARHGLAPALSTFIVGKQALQAVLDGQADLAVVADTPFMLAVMKGEPVAALATIFASRTTLALAANRERGINSAQDLRGKRIGTLFGTNAQYFIDNYLVANGIPREQVHIIGLHPEELADAIISGKVDAVTAWHPELARISQTMGQRVALLYGEDLFVYRFLIVGKKTYIDHHEATLRALLATLQEANLAILHEPEQARALIGTALKLDEGQLQAAFNAHDYTLSLDQSLLLALSDQSRWAIASGVTVRQALPNYLQALRTAPLAAVAPSAVKIIQ